MRVVIATDLSEASLAAVELMTSCSPLAFERVALVHAVDVDLYTAGGTVPEVVEYAQEHLARIAVRLEEAGFETTVRVEVGSAVDIIERTTAEEGAELVIMTNLGRGAVTGRLLGSTAELLASKGNLPVLIERVGEREGAWCRIGEGAPFDRVLVGADLTESLPTQLAAVSALPGLGEVRIVHVADPGLDPEPVRERLALLAAGCLPDVPCEYGVRTDLEAVLGLLAEADEWGATMIAVSPTAHGIVHRAIWGSTARRIAKESSLPVLFVPTAADKR